MGRPPAVVKTVNKAVLLVCGRRVLPLYAVLRHRGRRSGREYETPVAVVPTADAFVIALPWGRGTDWVRNVRAAGGCTVRWKGRDVTCTDPEFVGKDVALAAANRVLRWVLERREFEGGFLRLHRAQ